MRGGRSAGEPCPATLPGRDRSGGRAGPLLGRPSASSRAHVLLEQRLGQQEALRERAAGVLEQPPLPDGLDALGDGVSPSRCTSADDRVEQRERRAGRSRRRAAASGRA